MNNTANALLAIGASPVMAHATDEVEDIVSISSSLVINMGTLSKKWIDAMILAATKAKELNKPIVFDPVGVGASKFRTETAQKIIRVINAMEDSDDVQHVFGNYQFSQLISKELDERVV